MKGDFVMDCSIAASFLLPDEKDPIAIKAFNLLKTKKTIVPSLFFWEIGNVLNVTVRRNRFDLSLVSEVFDILNKLPIVFDKEPEFYELNKIMSLAQRNNLTIYDASYLETAIRYKVPLITLDNSLREACKKEKVKCKL